MSVGIRRQNVYLTCALVMVAVTKLNYVSAFTSPPPRVVSASYHCTSTEDGNRMSSFKAHSKSSSSAPLPLSQPISPLVPLPQLLNDGLENDSTLIGALSGLNMPLMQDILKEGSEQKLSGGNSEFDLMLGKAMDTLRKDYPALLKELPDFSIYDEDIEVVDPSGFKLHNLDRYKGSFRFLHGMLNFFYDRTLSQITFKIIYDCARKDIRLSWHAYLVPRAIYGGEGNALYIDGISVYVLDRLSGLIVQHRVEKLLLNDTPVKSPQDILKAMRVGVEEGTEGVPVWNIEVDMKGAPSPGQFNLEFRRHAGLPTGTRTLSLFSGEDNVYSNHGASTRPTMSRSLLSSESSSDGAEEPSSNPTTSKSDNVDNHLFDEVALERKNASRRRFGLKPITPDEFTGIRNQVEEMESTQQEKASAAQSATEMTKPKQKSNLFGNLFGGILQDTCESNWDCERPEVCCDLGFKKMCCSSGMGIFDPQPQMVPVRVPLGRVDDGLPRGGPDANIY